MFRKLLIFVCVVYVLGLASSLEAGALQQKGWTLPATAKTEKNPLTVNDATLAAGKKLFLQKCERCHGPEGKGDGQDADTHHIDHMNLTNPKNAASNPDGVVFYKIWHGRQEPRMPAFEDQLTKDQAWAIVAYVQSLRKK